LTEARPARPVLATVIALWEVFIVVVAIAARVAIRVLRHAHQQAHQAAHTSTRITPSSPSHAAGLILGYALAIGAAIALWQMHRSAFVFLTARFVVELALFIMALLHPAKTLDSLIPLFVFAVDIFALALNAAIVWYAYHITTPRSIAAPIPESETPVEHVVENLNENQSVSQFYIAHIDDRRDRN
jgi:hypothetical protein